jgi:hypothetical protein
MRYYLLLLCLAGLACGPRNLEWTNPEMTYAPVYASPQVYDSIDVLAPTTTVTAGKIYAYSSYAFQVDQYKGIHIVTDAHLAQAKKVAFLKIPWCTEVAVKGSYLYANNLNDLLVFDIANPQSPQLVKRLANAFPSINQTYPPENGVYFECADPSKGIVVRWERKKVENPKCRR